MVIYLYENTKITTNCCLYSYCFQYNRLIYEHGPPEGGPTPREKREVKQGTEKKKRQEFALGEHEVLTQDKISRDYVTQISGSVDIVGYSEETKNDSFYRNEVVAPCELLLQLYAKNRMLFTDSARLYIEENLLILNAIANEKPRNHKTFLALAGRFSKEQIYGPDGVLNL